MREIKFVTHITRNFYLYFVVYLALKLVFGYEVGIGVFLLGLFAYVLGYTPVYFLNDSQDWQEDKRFKSSNLYSFVGNPTLFWVITIVLIVVGAFFGLTTSVRGYGYMLLAYLFNIFHSVRPFVVRNRLLVGTVNYLLLSVAKFYLIVYYLHFIPDSTVIPIMLFFVFVASFAGLIYKRQKQRNVLVEYAVGTLLTVSTLVVTILYPVFLVFVIPLILILFYIAVRYKFRKVPVNQFQLLYFGYTVLIFIISLTLD